MTRASRLRRLLQTRFLTFCASFIPYVSLVVLGIHGALAGPSPLSKNAGIQNHKVRVRLAQDLSKISIRGFDLRLRAREGITDSYVSDRNSSWELQCKKNGKIQAKQIAGSKTALLDFQSFVEIESPTGFLIFHGTPYRDVLRIYSLGAGQCEVVNEVDLEKYLDGLVNVEFSSRWSEASVEAQVIAARTYALFQMREARRRKDNRYDLDATVRDQVYDGSIKEHFLSSRIVEKTRGMVLTAAVGKNPLPIKAFYHSSCGGITELPEHVWGKAQTGFKRSVTCPYCVGSPRFNWTVEISSTEIAQALLKNRRSKELKLMLGAQLTDLRIVEMGTAGRAGVLEALFEPSALTLPQGRSIASQKLRNPHWISVKATAFRESVGPSRLKSTWFSVTQGSRPHLWRFTGRGFGHGVGMCQWGAKAMGEKGFTVSGILSHYYPDAVLKKLW